MSNSFRVELYVYDLSMGMAAMFSQQFTGKHFPGIWHTAIVVYGREYFFGGGIQVMAPLTTPYGQPIKRIHLGDTQMEQALFDEYVNAIGSERFRMDQYNLFENNCNNFTNECSNFLLGRNIPDDILGLPREFFQTPIGQMVRPMIDQMMGGSAHPNMMGSGGGGNPMFDQMMGGNGGFGGNGGGDMMSMMNNPMVQNMINQMGGLQGMMNNPMVQNMMNNYMGGGSGSSFGNNNNNTQPLPKKFSDPFEIYRNNKSNVPQVVAKLKTTNGHLITGDDMNVLNQLEQYLQLTQDQQKDNLITNQTFQLLQKLLKNTKESDSFPILDLLRLLILSNKYSKTITTGEFKEITNIVEERFVSQWTSCTMPTQLMVLRLYCNLFDRYYSQQSLMPDNVKFLIKLERLSKIVDMITTSLSSELEGLRLVATSLSANLTLYLPHQNSDEEIQLLSSMLEYIPTEKSRDVALRMLLSIYRIVKGHGQSVSEIREIASALIESGNRFTSGPGIQLLTSEDDRLLISELKTMLALK